MNKKPLEKLEALCVCGEQIPFDHNILKVTVQCPNYLKQIDISYCSLSDLITASLRKAGREFEEILRNGSKSRFKEIFNSKLDKKAKALKDNKEVYFLLGNIGPFDLTEEESFCEYYSTYQNPEFVRGRRKNHPSQPSIEDAFKVSIEESDEYYILCYVVPFYADSLPQFSPYFDYPDIEFFVRFFLIKNYWLLYDGRLIWVSLHPEAGPFSPSKIRDKVRITKKKIKQIEEEFGEEVARIFLPFSLHEASSVLELPLGLLTKEQFDKEIRFHKLEEKKDRIKEISSNGGFIATATYGDCNHPNVMIFRNYRDSILSNSLLGRAFIKFYYKCSPNVAILVRQDALLQRIIKICLNILACFMDKSYNHSCKQRRKKF